MSTKPHFSRMSKARGRLLLLKLCQGGQTVEQIAADFGMTEIDLANWIAGPGRLASLQKLMRLHEVRAQALLSSGRADAAARLASIAVNNERNETCRKACLDNLKSSTPVLPDPNPGEPNSPMQPPPVPTETMILRALETLGAQDLDSYEDNQLKDD